MSDLKVMIESSGVLSKKEKLAMAEYLSKNDLPFSVNDIKSFSHKKHHPLCLSQLIVLIPEEDKEEREFYCNCGARVPFWRRFINFLVSIKQK